MIEVKVKALAIVLCFATHFPTLPTHPGWAPSGGKQGRKLLCPNPVLSLHGLDWKPEGQEPSATPQVRFCSWSWKNFNMLELISMDLEYVSTKKKATQTKKPLKYIWEQAVAWSFVLPWFLRWSEESKSTCISCDKALSIIVGELIMV